MTFATKPLKQALKRASRAVYLVALTSSLLLSPVAHALQIRLGSNMNLRVFKNDELKILGTLAAGSVVEIPDKYKLYDKNGNISALASFNNWLNHAGYTKSDVNKQVRDPKLDFYFPVKIVSLARGSTVSRKLIGKTHYMALRVLAKSKGRLSVNRNSPVYNGPTDDSPLWPQDPAEDQEPTLAAASQTAEADTAQRLEGQGTCENCDLPDAPPPAPYEAVAQTSAALDHSTTELFDKNFRSNDLPTLPSTFFRGGAACDKFIKKDGSGYGPYGQELLRQISEPKMRAIYMSNNNGVARAACPNFNKFSDEEKEHFWVWAFAALSWQESKCGTDKRSGYMNPNGASVGLYHIENNTRLRENRDDLYGGTYCSGDPTSLRVNTRCSVRMLATPLKAGQGPWSRANQYWGPFKFKESGEWVRVRIGKNKYKSIFIKNYTKPMMRQNQACFAETRK